MTRMFAPTSNTHLYVASSHFLTCQAWSAPFFMGSHCSHIIFRCYPLSKEGTWMSSWTRDGPAQYTSGTEHTSAALNFGCLPHKMPYEVADFLCVTFIGVTPCPYASQALAPLFTRFHSYSFSKKWRRRTKMSYAFKHSATSSTRRLVPFIDGYVQFSCMVSCFCPLGSYVEGGIATASGTR